MPTLTEHDIHQLYTHAGWGGDTSHVPPATEKLAALVVAAKVLPHKRGEFQEMLLRIHRLFCNQAQHRGASPHGKIGASLRDSLSDISKQSEKLLKVLRTVDEEQLASVLATTKGRSLGKSEVSALRREVMRKVSALQGLCNDAVIESSPGPDMTLLRSTLLYLIMLYETCTGREAGRSKDKEGHALAGPLVRLIRGFFKLFPKELLESEGIKAAKLNRAITNALKEHKSIKKHSVVAEKDPSGQKILK